MMSMGVQECVRAVFANVSPTSAAVAFHVAPRKVASPSSKHKQLLVVHILTHVVALGYSNRTEQCSLVPLHTQ
jgi:hypothetical protein